MTSINHLETDVVQTSAGPLAITFLGHASLLMNINGKNIIIDPYTQELDYSTLPKADLILCTHEHFDHLDPKAFNIVRTEKTTVVMNAAGVKQIGSGITMRNGDVKDILDIRIEAVAAYNLVHKRDDGQPFHSKGDGNGYILNFGKNRVYIAGDTENIPEMKSLKEIDIAFLPMNLPYTMTPEMVADAARTIRPQVLYPYHYGKTEVSKLVNLLKSEKDIDLRIRKMA